MLSRMQCVYLKRYRFIFLIYVCEAISVFYIFMKLSNACIAHVTHEPT